MPNPPEADATILIAGFGSAGRRHFRNLRALGRSRFVFLRSGSGIIDDAEIAAYPTATSIEEALRHEPTIAVIAGPTSTHAAIAMAAAAAGCDLYIEKPISHDLAEAKRLGDIVAANGRVAMVGCQFRFHPLLREAARLLQEGSIGRVVGASASWGEYLPAWHPWEDHRRSYSARLDLGGGVLPTLIHPVDYLIMLFGRCDVRGAVTARVPALETPAGEDWGDLLLAFESGVEAHVHLDYIQQPPQHVLQVVGDRGRLECDFLAGALRCWSEGRLTTVGVPEGFDRNTMFLDAISHFLACVDQRAQPRCTVEDGVLALKVVLDARRIVSEGVRLAQPV